MDDTDMNLEATARREGAFSPSSRIRNRSSHTSLRSLLLASCPSPSDTSPHAAPPTRQLLRRSASPSTWNEYATSPPSHLFSLAR